MKSDTFLQLYRTYESLLREQKGIEPKDEEANVDGLIGDRLRMCRQFRNYFVHTSDPGFLEVSDKMGKFLSDYVDALKSKGDTVKKHMKRSDTCIVPIKGHMSDALDVFNKYKQFSVVIDMGDGSYGTLSVFDSVGVDARAKLETLKIRKIKPVFCAPLDDFQALDMDRITLCTDDGTAKGKLLGQVIFV